MEIYFASRHGPRRGKQRRITAGTRVRLKPLEVGNLLAREWPETWCHSRAFLCLFAQSRAI